MAVSNDTKQPNKNRNRQITGKSRINIPGNTTTISVAELQNLQSAALGKEEINALSDISEVSIQGSTSLERLESLMRQVSNPYYFRVGTTPVKLVFNKDGAPFEEILKSHFLSLKQKT